jgi:small subunit ribosomal protein S15
MSMTAERKTTLVHEFATKDGDTGSPEVQAAVLSERIKHLSAHLTTHIKDFHSRRGLLMMVGKRRRLLEYLKRTSAERYERLIDRLELRR